MTGIESPIAIGIAAATMSWLLARAARTVANQHGVMDVPNDRSSHKSPTPRGGGVAIVVVVVGVEIILFAIGLLHIRVARALILPGLVVGGLGMWDDIRTLSALPRLLIQSASALFAVWSLSTNGPETSAATAYMVYALQIVGIIWLTNLYNFMDGIDGIAATQGIVAALADAVLLHAVGATSLATIAVATAGAAAGFLTVDWAPATIFMGDVGSSFLGFTFAVLSISVPSMVPVLSHSIPPTLLTVLMLLPLCPFMVDATITLGRRAIRGERVMAAHREHAYQRAVRAGFGHNIVAVIVGVLSLIASLAAIAAFHFQAYALPLIASALLTSLATFIVSPRLQG